ncbi:MAG: trypco2 family protein [bacterium]
MSKPTQITTEGIGLQELIQQLRADLSRAMKDGENADLRFELQAIDLELQVVVTKEDGGQIGFKILPFSGTATDKLDRKVTQTIKLKLAPSADSSKLVSDVRDLPLESQ